MTMILHLLSALPPSRNYLSLCANSFLSAIIGLSINEILNHCGWALVVEDVKR